MSFEPMRQSTSLFEKINEALEPIFLTQDEFEKLSDAIPVSYTHLTLPTIYSV